MTFYFYIITRKKNEKKPGNVLSGLICMIQEYDPQFSLTPESTNDKVDYNSTFHLRCSVQYVRGQCQMQWRLVADGHDVCLLDMCSDLCLSVRHAWIK